MFSRLARRCCWERPATDVQSGFCLRWEEFIILNVSANNLCVRQPAAAPGGGAGAVCIQARGILAPRCPFSCLGSAGMEWGTAPQGPPPRHFQTPSCCPGPSLRFNDLRALFF